MVRSALYPLPRRRPDGLPEGFPALVPPTSERQGFAGPAGLRLRHMTMIALFVLLVPLPGGVAAWYLYTRAQDQFVSTFGFVVHAEGDAPAGNVLAAVPGLSALAGTPSSDTDILDAYLDSQALVTEVDEALDLAALWSGGHVRDPVFAFDPDGSIEDLTRYWRRMVHVAYDHGAGLMEVEVRSFDAESARRIARAVEAACSELINRLGGIARADRVHHARRELRLAETRLGAARRALTEFRVANRVVDPLADLEGEMGVIHGLRQALAEETVALELLERTIGSGGANSRRTAVNDTRVRQSERRIAALERRIAEERRVFGDPGGQRDLARLMGDYERLSVDVEVAQEAHALALVAFQTTRAAADRQSRYLAPYSSPTRAERALYPRRLQTLALLTGGLFFGWSLLMLIIYSLRDRY
ncbi:capsule polysaccharide export inner-membrane protein [Pseudooceanicola batsensis HTCC2597]|uniref:Capsule polysaccharide export inner-membrane protein n=1 Tax=Pseudooceanicola batsensis (strain ATCC BAA-863 / DSM 15984 / KCTC 12145 / HTCC2597) TaxID=252305 RepID=A3TY55_PSEBH|nr:sugar transporter [Pseudooceanicola batsensis]EAQ03089.1 capsule polysaccharide export inner-membrane protein [Pseudooceanicola batsensis HTCC2597]